MDIISQFANREQTEEILNGNSELKRFASEFCYAFNCRVSSVSSIHVKSLSVLTPNGLHGGTLRVDNRGALDKDSNPIPVYYYGSNLVTKDKGSSRSDKNTRDSTKISTLITSVRKHGEFPTEERLVRSFRRGVAYAMHTVGRSRSTPSLSLPNEEVLAAVEYSLGLDTEKIKMHTASLLQSYQKYKASVKEVNEMKSHGQRFNDGCYAVCIVTDGPKHYLFGEVSGADRDDITFHGSLKRYSTLRDVPELAGHLPIICTWAESAYPDYRDANDFSFPARDQYYEDIDVATGYETHNAMWVLIPKTAP